MVPFASSARRDKSREWGRLKAKVEPLLTLSNSGLPARAALRGLVGVVRLLVLVLPAEQPTFLQNAILRHFSRTQSDIFPERNS